MKRTVLKKQKVQCRTIKSTDFDSICELQLACFPGMKPWSRQQFDSILSIFPEGQFCVEYDGKMVASSCSLIINKLQYTDTASWNELTNMGYITNHDPEGDTLYGMEIMVHPEYRLMKLARRLYEFQEEPGQGTEFKKHTDRRQNSGLPFILSFDGCGRICTACDR